MAEPTMTHLLPRACPADDPGKTAKAPAGGRDARGTRFPWTKFRRQPRKRQAAFHGRSGFLGPFISIPRRGQEHPASARHTYVAGSSNPPGDSHATPSLAHDRARRGRGGNRPSGLYDNYVKLDDYNATISELHATDQRMQSQIDSLAQKYDMLATEVAGRIEVQSAAHFATGDATLSEQDKPFLADFAKVLGSHHPDAVVTVEGFSDPQGSASANLRLGQARAQAVSDFLVSSGMNASQLSYRQLWRCEGSAGAPRDVRCRRCRQPSGCARNRLCGKQWLPAGADDSAGIVASDGPARTATRRAAAG